MKRLLFSSLSFLIILTLSSQNIDSLWHVYSHSTHHDLYQIANQLNQALVNDNYLDSIYHFKPSTETDEIESALFTALGTYFYDKNNYHDALIVTQQSALASEKRNNNAASAESYSLLCVLYQRLGDFEQALDYAKLCYQIDESNHDLPNMSHSLHNLASLQLFNKHPQTAKQYIIQAIAIERQQNDNKTLAVRLGLASEVFLALNEYDKAIDFAKEAFLLDKKEKREEKAAIRLCQLAAVYQAKKDLTKAKKYYEIAIKPLREDNNFNSLSIDYLALGNIAKEQGNNELSKAYYQKSIKAAEQIGNRLQCQKGYTAMAELLQHTEPQNAIKYYKHSMELRDTIFTAESEKQINNFNIKYKTREQELQIETQQQIIEQNKKIQYLLIFIIVLFVAVFGLTIYTIITQRRRIRALAEINALKNKLFSIVSHDLKNPALAIQMALKLLEQNSSRFEPEVAEQITLLSKASDTQVALIKNLLEWARIQSNRIIYTPIKLNLNSVIREIESNLYEMAKQKNITLDHQLPESCIITSDRILLTTILRNLTSNAIKFSANGQHILIEAKQKGKQYYLSVTDHGVGMTPKQIKEILTQNYINTTEDTNHEKGTGLGLAICKDLINICKARLSITSEPLKGTTFTIIFQQS